MNNNSVKMFQQSDLLVKSFYIHIEPIPNKDYLMTLNMSRSRTTLFLLLFSLTTSFKTAVLSVQTTVPCRAATCKLAPKQDTKEVFGLVRSKQGHQGFSFGVSYQIRAFSKNLNVFQMTHNIYLNAFEVSPVLFLTTFVIL